MLKDKQKKPRNYQHAISSAEFEDLILIANHSDEWIYLQQCSGYQGEQLDSIALTLGQARELLRKLPEAIEAKIKIDKFHTKNI